MIKAGGGLSASKSIAPDSVTTEINSQPTGIDPDSLETKTLGGGGGGGGGFNIDLGYQFFPPLQRSFMVLMPLLDLVCLSIK